MLAHLQETSERNLAALLDNVFKFAIWHDKVRELIERGGGLIDSEAKNVFEYGIGMGRGGLYLNLTDD